MSDFRPLRLGPRRPHRKVRTGCSICKTRKVKCDEQAPICGPCTKYGATTCDIVKVAAGLGRIPPSFISPSLGESDINLSDLELLHHWTTWTSDTISDGGEHLRIFWRDSAVRIALRQEYVMHSLLAVAALHIAHLARVDGDIQREQIMVDRAVTHHEVSCREAGKVLAEMSRVSDGNGGAGTQTQVAEMAEGLFMFGTFTLHYVMAASNDPCINFFGSPSPNNSSTSTGFDRNRIPPGGASADWYVLYSGQHHFVSSCAARTNSSSAISPFVRHVRSCRDLCRLRKPNGTYLGPLKRRMREVTLVGEGDEGISGRKSGVRAAYDHAISELDDVLATIFEFPQSRDSSYVFCWLTVVSDDFLPLLKAQGSPPQEAVVVFVYFCFALEYIPSHWWLDDWRARLKAGAYELLDEEHTAWIVEPEFESL